MPAFKLEFAFNKEALFEMATERASIWDALDDARQIANRFAEAYRKTHKHTRVTGPAITKTVRTVKEDAPSGIQPEA